MKRVKIDRQTHRIASALASTIPDADAADVLGLGLDVLVSLMARLEVAGAGATEPEAVTADDLLARFAALVLLRHGAENEDLQLRGYEA